MAVVLARIRQNLDGMFGSLSFNGEPLCVTVERPWKNNQPEISCVPPGEYPCVPYKSPSKGLVWLLQNVPDRSEVEIHAANVAAQLRGCVAVGKTFATFPEFNNAQGVTNSKMTLLMLQSKLPPTFTLTILDPH